MSRNRTEQTRTRRAGQQHSGNPPPGQATQDTWEGGGREPVHPDDIGDEGECPGNAGMRQQLRSDDN